MSRSDMDAEEISIDNETMFPSLMWGLRLRKYKVLDLLYQIEEINQAPLSQYDILYKKQEELGLQRIENFSEYWQAYMENTFKDLGVEDLEIEDLKRHHIKVEDIFDLRKVKKERYDPKLPTIPTGPIDIVGPWLKPKYEAMDDDLIEIIVIDDDDENEMGIIVLDN